MSLITYYLFKSINKILQESLQLLQNPIMYFKYIFLLFIPVIILSSCKNNSSNNQNGTIKGEIIPLKYAEGFSIMDLGNYKILEIKNPWPKSEKTYKYALITEVLISKIDLNSSEFDAVLSIPIKKMVVTSTTHIPAIELLGEKQTLIGFPGLDYISSEIIRQRIDSGNIRELGSNESINTEVLLELNPDVVIGFGIDGNNKAFETIKKSKIPVIYNGDWVESSPLAKAEWIKFFGLLYNKEKQADSIFNTIEKNYLDAKQLASNVKFRPTILSGAMHNDIWYLPNGNSTEAQLLKDANTNYLWKDSKGTGSLSLNFETVFEKAKDADIWLNPSNYVSLDALKKSNSHNTMFKAFQTNNIYSFTNTTGKTGSVLYYELGMTRPDKVLKDIIKICHPELLENYQPYFFKKLE